MEPLPPVSKTTRTCNNCKVETPLCACTDCMSESYSVPYCHLCSAMYSSAIKQSGLSRAQKLYEDDKNSRRNRMGL